MRDFGFAATQRARPVVPPWVAVFERWRRHLRIPESAVQDLVAVSFSLWRAVFLADRSGKTVAKLGGAEAFLAKTLTDNAIAFAQDRTAREWSFSYYVDNAFYRLEAIEAIPKSKRTTRERWEFLQEHFERAIDDLERKLTGRTTKDS
jgi:hypothetical protein